MKISCPTCSAKYSIADEKVQNRLAKIRCRKCGTSIVIDGNVSPANVYAADAAPAASPEPEAAAAVAPAAAAPAAAEPATPAEASYTVDLGENDQRPMSMAQLVEAYNNGSVTAETYVWADGFPDWTPLGQVEDIVAALHAAAASADPGPSASLDEASAVGASTHIDEKPWDSGPSSPVAAGASGAGPQSGGGPDLFGSVSDAGNETDGVSTGTAANPFSGANTGARNESSVLFSLSALTSGTGSSRPSVPAPAASSSGSTNDDSGLIDLKALTAGAAGGAAGAPAAPPMAPAAGVSPFGASPLGAPSPLATPSIGASSLRPMPAQKSNTGLIIGASIVVAAIAVAAIVTFGGGDEQPVAPPVPAVSAPPVAAPAPAPAPEPAPAPAAAASDESEAKPPATGTEEEKPAPTAPKPKTYSKPKTSSPSPAPTPKPSAPAPKPKPKSSGKCGCKSDDLMCLMNCAK